MVVGAADQHSPDYVLVCTRIGVIINMTISIAIIWVYNWVSSHLHTRVHLAESMQKQFFSVVWYAALPLSDRPQCVRAWRH